MANAGKERKVTFTTATGKKVIFYGETALDAKIAFQAWTAAQKRPLAIGVMVGNLKQGQKRAAASAHETRVDVRQQNLQARADAEGMTLEEYREWQRDEQAMRQEIKAGHAAKVAAILAQVAPVKQPQAGISAPPAAIRPIAAQVPITHQQAYDLGFAAGKMDKSNSQQNWARGLKGKCNHTHRQGNSHIRTAYASSVSTTMHDPSQDIKKPKIREGLDSMADTHYAAGYRAGVASVPALPAMKPQPAGEKASMAQLRGRVK